MEIGSKSPTRIKVLCLILSNISSLKAFQQTEFQVPTIHRRSKMFKIIALVACLAVVASARYYGGDHGHYHEEYHHSHPKYKFEYGVKDGHTHDHKSAWETRDGDVVKGQYTLEEADGTHRVVDYSSDHKGGFQAHVQRNGHAHHPHGESYVKIDQHY